MMDAHPAAALFPLMSATEYAGLLEDIRQHGLREPIVVDSKTKTILDGRNRYRACRELGIKPDFEWYDGDDPTGYVVSLNLHRRHLNESQRAMIAARLANAGEGRPSVTASIDAVTQPEAAKLLNVSRPSVQRARVVLSEGTPEMIAAVDAGKVTVSKAAKAAKAAKAEKSAKVAERLDRTAVPQLPDKAPKQEVHVGQWWTLGRHRLYCGDTSGEEFIGKLEACAFAFADPPYNADKADWDAGFEWAHDYLSDKARTVAVTPGIASLFTFARLTTMPYFWSLAAWIDNGMTRGALGYGNWIYLALFGEKPDGLRIQDIIRLSISKATDTDHPTRKPAALLARLLDVFTAEGDTVIDPFLGSGTTLFAAEATNRACIGGEINPAYCAEIIARWQSATGQRAEVRA